MGERKAGCREPGDRVLLRGEKWTVLAGGRGEGSLPAEAKDTDLF